MIRTGLKLLVAALILHGLYQVGYVYWQHYEFQDAVEQTALFSNRATAEELRVRILDIVHEMDMPIAPEALTVERDQRRTTVDATYQRTVKLLPRYERPWDFTIHVVVFSVN